MCSRGPNQELEKITDNDLMANRRQAFVLTNDGSVDLRTIRLPMPMSQGFTGLESRV